MAGRGILPGVYPTKPYPEDPSTIVANGPWSGHYRVWEALWGYAHYCPFTQIGGGYIGGGSGRLSAGGTFVSLVSPKSDYSVIIETKGATAPQTLRIANSTSNPQTGPQPSLSSTTRWTAGRNPVGKAHTLPST